MTDDTTRGNPGGRRPLPPEVKEAIRGMSRAEIKALVEHFVEMAKEIPSDPKTRAIYERANESLRRAVEEQENARKDGGS